MTVEISSNYESKFWNILEDIFTGAEVEGKSGYINLLGVKRKYFKNYLKPNLQEYINNQLSEFPAFKEELYQKLYYFFRRYFSETGSIYFSYTPLYYKIYDKVYKDSDKKEVYFKPSEENYNTDLEQILSDRKDVSLFWKTHMLYYIKTDKIIRSMKVELPEDILSFYFDASDVENAKNNEKRSFIYELKEVKKDGTIVLKVSYSENNKKTKHKEIIKQVKKKNKYIKLTEESLNKAIQTFEKQMNVDYFINKNPEKFLKEQFDLWMYQYLFSQEVNFDIKRFKELQALRNIAYRVIEFIAKFEDKLRKIWEKPRLVFNSNYVITLDRITKKENGLDLIKEILKQLKEQEKDFKENLEKLKNVDSSYKSFREKFENYEAKNQLEEWYLLGIIDEDFNVEDMLKENKLNEKYQFLPVDTKHFEGLKEKIEELFNIDEELDGRLIKSENWQALNTILEKYKNKIQTIYIDPPFNKEQEADYLYKVGYKDATWITMLENRIRLARDLLKDTGSIFVRCDYNGNMYVRLLMNEIFGEENFRNEIIIGRTKTAPYIGTSPEKAGVSFKNLMFVYDNLYLYSRTDNFFNNFSEGIIEEKREPYWKDFKTFFDRDYNRYTLLGLLPEKGCSWMWRKEVAEEAVRNYEEYLRISADENISLEEYWEKTGRKFNFIKKEGNTLKYWVTPYKKVSHNNWSELEGYGRRWNFPTENSEPLLKRVIKSISKEGDLVLDFFLGSGTTTAVAHKLKRKWIGIEMGEHFYTVILPRMKKVLAYDKSGISKEKDVKEKYNKKNAGGFFKYYELEQYEDILKTVDYADKDAKEFYEKLPTVLKEDFKYSDVDPFIFDKKLANAIDIETEEIKIDKLYPDKEIDIVESISNILGIPFDEAKNIVKDKKTLIKLLRY